MNTKYRKSDSARAANPSRMGLCNRFVWKITTRTPPLARIPTTDTQEATTTTLEHIRVVEQSPPSPIAEELFDMVS